jgi:hypothetical protein
MSPIGDHRNRIKELGVTWAEEECFRLISYKEAANGGQFATREQPGLFAERFARAFRSLGTYLLTDSRFFV